MSGLSVNCGPELQVTTQSEKFIEMCVPVWNTCCTVKSCMILQRTDLVFAECPYREFAFSGEQKLVLENDILDLTVAWCWKATNI